jgi:uncharacterized protein YbjT (DUF2867 family)
MIVVTGAAGRTGRAVVREVARAGHTVRAYVRSRGRAAPLLRDTTPWLVEGELGDPGALGIALEGATAAILIAAAEPEQLAQLDLAIATAIEAGVPRLVLLSTTGAAPNAACDIARWHWRAEQRLAPLGERACAVRTTRYMQTLVQQVPTILTAGMFVGCQGEGRVADVDARDVAAVLAAAVDPARVPEPLVEVTGGEAADLFAVAALLARHLGRPVRYVDCPPAQVVQALLAAGLSEWQAHDRASFDIAARRGQFATVTDTVQRITGAPPRRWEAYLRELARSLRPGPGAGAGAAPTATGAPA